MKNLIYRTISAESITKLIIKSKGMQNKGWTTFGELEKINNKYYQVMCKGTFKHEIRLETVGCD